MSEVVSIQCQDINKRAIEARRVAVLSTGHLAQKTMELLDKKAADGGLLRLGTEEVVSLRSFAYGVLCLRIQDMDSEKEKRDFDADDCSDAPELTSIIKCLTDDGDFHAIEFDRDGPVVEGFQTFEW